MVWTQGYQGYQNKNLWTDVNSYAAPYKQLIHDLKRNQQTIDGSKITATTTDQSLQLSRFDDQSHHDKTDLSEPRPET